MSLTEQQQEEVKIAINETLKVERFIKWVPVIVCVAAVIGTYAVFQYRVEAAEKDLESKADKVVVDHVRKQTDLKLEIIQHDVDNIKEDVNDIKQTNRDILKEIRRNNGGS